ncbi:MAG: type II toxin-antitoxin system VapC family toxin [Pseudomonadota bacterium]
MVDSCVLLDIFNDDPNWYDWSADTLYSLSSDHQLIINTIIFTEVAFNFDNAETLEKALKSLGITIEGIPLPAAFNVSQVFRQYRKNKGGKKSPMPDFYIGEHAQHLNIPLVTRDTARFKTYQPNLTLITPEES